VLFFVFISNKFSSHCGSVIFTIFTNNKTYEYSFDAIDLLKIKITDREILASLKKAINSHQSKSSFDIVNLLLWSKKAIEKNGSSNNFQGINFLI
jgi:hypothetical protein